MMLTPEQLRNMRQAANGLWKVEFDGRGIRQIVAHIDAQQARIAELERDRYHWKANHENQVRRARILLERPDMPIERVKAYQHMQELDQAAARYRWLRDKMLGVDFDWNESGLTALCFEMPDGCAYGGNCDQNIDAAMQK